MTENDVAITEVRFVVFATIIGFGNISSQFAPHFDLHLYKLQLTAELKLSNYAQYLKFADFLKQNKLCE